VKNTGCICSLFFVENKKTESIETILADNIKISNNIKQRKVRLWKIYGCILRARN